MRFLKYLAPYGLYLWAIHRANRQLQPPLPIEELRANRSLRECETGKRGFILGNGPSVKELDLTSLSGELVVSVSNGYLHQDYELIRPKYHCVPQISYVRMTEADVVLWFTEMHEHIGDATLFLNETERDLVRRHGLFEGRVVHYLALREDFDALADDAIIDLSKTVPRVESVPVMALMVAMYLGVKQIFMLGVDHDHFLSGVYLYAFDLQVQSGKDFSVKSDGQLTISRHDDFQSLARLWRQYRRLRRIADRNGIQIFNATPGGALDEFPRISYGEALEVNSETI